MTALPLPPDAAVRHALAEVTGLPLDGIDTTRTIDDLGLDSLDFVRVVQLAEDAAGLRLDDAAISTVTRPADLIALMEIQKG